MAWCCPLRIRIQDSEVHGVTEAKEWHINKRKGISKEIRHMTKEERQRAKEKERANKCTQSNLKKTPQ